MESNNIQIKTRRILVIDDEEGILSLFQRLFHKKRNIELFTVSTGQEGLKLILEKDIDVVLLDVILPDISGIEVLKVIKNRRPDIQVIIITGTSSIDDAVKATKLGASNYITKPFESDIVLKVVDGALDRNLAREEYKSRKKIRLGELLLQDGLISKEDIDSAVKEQEQTGVRLGEALVNLNILTHDDINWALSHQLNIPYVRINKESIDSKIFKIIPPEVAKKYNVVPTMKIGNELNIVIADPLNIDAIEELEQISGCKINVCVGELNELQSVINDVYGEEYIPKIGEEILDKDISVVQESIKNVAKSLGPGFFKQIYQKALEIEFNKKKLKNEKEVVVPIIYDNQEIGRIYIDLVVDKKFMIKIIDSLDSISLAKRHIQSAFKSTGLKTGIIVNFDKDSSDMDIIRLNPLNVLR